MADVDWVKLRAACTLQKIFFRLVAGAKSDVDARIDTARAQSENVCFEKSNEGARLLVTRTEGPEVKRVEFALSSGAITVEGDGIRFRAKPGLNNSGDCTLMVDGQELELWQVRRMALEALFFEETPTAAVSAQRKKQ